MEQDSSHHSERDAAMMRRFESGIETDPEKPGKKKKKKSDSSLLLAEPEGHEARADKSHERDNKDDNNEKKEFEETRGSVLTELRPDEKELAELSQDEVDEAFWQIVEAEQLANRTELAETEASGVERAQALAEAKLLENMAGSDPDQAYEKTAAMLHEIAEEHDEPEINAEQTTETQELNTDQQDEQEQPEALPDQNNTAISSPEPDDPDPNDPNTAQANRVPPTVPPPPGPPPGPPNPPNNPNNPNPNNPNNQNNPNLNFPPMPYIRSWNRGNNNGPPQGPNYNVYHNPPNFNAPQNPNTIHTHSVEYRRQRRGSDLLLGGIVGYLIGRRRGRIKTEERLLPIQANLERRVRSMQETVESKETQIRSLVTEKYERQGEQLKREQLISRLESSLSQKPGVETQPERHPELNIKSNEAKDADMLHSRQPERLGRVLMRTVNRPEAQMPVTSAAEITEQQPAAEFVLPVPIIGTERIMVPGRQEHAVKSAEIDPRDIKVNTLSDETVMELAKKLKVEGQSIQELYDGGRLTKDGVRQLVTEYTRGGNFEAILPKVMAGQERASERMHERRTDGTGTADAAGGGIGLAGGAIATSAALGGASDTASGSQPDPEAGRFPAVPEKAVNFDKPQRSQATQAVAAGTLVLTGLAIFLYLIIR